ncbi:MAG: efflux RND transporter permease subunit, partial [Christensenellaceae bacterium]|nr:efflux RND transporter permease subunit [Christensenellaceae bacterium]
TDLLPSMNMPYAAVFTTYPGASPEEVEQVVTRPVEQAMATMDNIKSINSVSSENASVVILEFDFSANMDSITVDMRESLDRLDAVWEDTGVTSPTIMKINPDMLPILMAAVDVDGQDVGGVSDRVNSQLLTYFEGVEGVASVSASGLLEEQIRVTISPEKIDALNSKILGEIDSDLAKAEKDIDKAEKELDKGQKALDEALPKAEEGLSQLADGLAQAKEGLATAKSARTALLVDIGQAQARVQALKADPTASPVTVMREEASLAGLQTSLSEQDETIAQLEATVEELEAQHSELQGGVETMRRQQTQLESGRRQLKTARSEFETARDEAFEKASLDGVITVDMVSGILLAENFSMPAGYVSEDGIDHLVKVGDKYTDMAALSSQLLFHIDVEGVGDVTLADVADVEMVNNASELYTKVNGSDGVILSFQKQSGYSTAEVSDNLEAAIAKLAESDPDVHVVPLMDQGIYIDMVIGAVLENLLYGGILAVLVLLLFLRSGRTTLVVAFSIPISVMVAIVLMYFSGVNLNLISLSGLALGVGMLVDNSIVVIENIYRLRSLGVPAKRAAITGAKQVAGAIVASTLTTVCVFLPLVFTEGMAKELFTDMGLTIAYSLLASLLVALTLVPCLSSNLLRKTEEKQIKWFERMKEAYGRMLRWNVDHKAVVLMVAVVLLIVCVWQTGVMGITFMPETNANQMSVSIEMPEGSTFEDTKAMSDTVMDRILQLEEVQTVGALNGGGMNLTGSSGEVGTMSFYLLLDENKTHTNIQLAEMITEKTADLACEVSVTANVMDISMLSGSGLEVQIKGEDLDELAAIGRDIAAMMGQIPGTVEIADGSEDSTPQLRITVDKEKAMREGLTVAQIFSEVADRLAGEKTATTVTLDNKDYPVVVIDRAAEEADIETVRKLPFTVEVEAKDEDGQPTGETEEKTVLLEDIAKISLAEGPSSIRREGQKRVWTVSCQMDSEHNVTLAGRELEKKLAEYQLPEGYSFAITGESDTINSTMSDMLFMVAVAIVLIYLIMVAQFQSLLSPFIVLFTLPLAFTGGLLALLLTGKELSVIAMLGFLVLAGVVVNNGIVLVDYINQLRIGGMEKKEAIIEAGKTRMRPILMTAVTTILGLTTMAFGVGMGADMVQPLAIVIIGGLIYSTLLTLFVVPSLYDIFNRKKEMKDPLAELDAGTEEV